MSMSILTFADGRHPHPLLKRVAASLGVESSAALWRPIALREHRRKLDRNPDYRAWIAERHDLDKHWGHEVVTDTFALMHLGSQLYEICRMLRRRVGDTEGKRILDAGASDGLFLREIGARSGVGVNFLEACARKIAEDGQLACLADVERLPFPDGAFDFVICCETLEHVPNPVSLLNELARVCRERLFLTIPWLPRTRINARPAGWPDVESHIFEFSEEDFARILTHARVRVSHRDLIEVFREPDNPVSRWWLGHWMYPNFFPKLQYYELTPVRG
jgi:SAM-dependent methyltransferase